MTNKKKILKIIEQREVVSFDDLKVITLIEHGELLKSLAFLVITRQIKATRIENERYYSLKK